MQSDVRVTDSAATALLDYLREQGYRAPLCVCDPNTHRAAGARVAAALSRAGIAVEEFVLERELPAADAESVGDILIGMKATPDVVLGVGGGTVTDIARLVAHRMGRPFLSYPTAPSVDAYSSPTSAMTFRGVKKTVPAGAPEVVFVDTEVLGGAPHEMVAAGFGDMVAKLTSTPDWRLAAVVAGEPFDEDIAGRTLRAVDSCVAQVELIAAHEPAALSTLLGGLIDSGDCMRDWGGSRPASGSEHLLSHYWEMKAHAAGREPALHGAKVALGTAVVAGLFERLAAMGVNGLTERLEAALPPSAAALRERAVRGFGEAGARALLESHLLSTMTTGRFEALRSAARDAAGRLIEIAGAAPAARRILDLMGQAGGVTHPRELGLDLDDVRDALAHAHFIRNRFGLLVFWHLFDLGAPEETAEAVFG
jgi:glycerol-1-phosphate dehydrogenase [NAD(P)+]